MNPFGPLHFTFKVQLDKPDAFSCRRLCTAFRQQSNDLCASHTVLYAVARRFLPCWPTSHSSLPRVRSIGIDRCYNDADDYHSEVVTNQSKVKCGASSKRNNTTKSLVCHCWRWPCVRIQASGQVLQGVQVCSRSVPCMTIELMSIALNKH